MSNGPSRPVATRFEWLPVLLPWQSDHGEPRYAFGESANICRGQGISVSLMNRSPLNGRFFGDVVYLLVVASESLVPSSKISNSPERRADGSSAHGCGWRVFRFEIHHSGNYRVLGAQWSGHASPCFLGNGFPAGRQTIFRPTHLTASSQALFQPRPHHDLH